MARPKKKNFDYFSHDVFAHQDRKLRKVARKHGPTAIAVFWEVLSVIYRTEGYFCRVDNDLFEDIAEAIFCPDSDAVTQIIYDFIEAGVFDKNTFTRKGILSSEAIQRRAVKMAEWRDYKIDPELILGKSFPEENSGENLGNSSFPQKNSSETNISQRENPCFHPGKPQFPCSKENKKKSKENKRDYRYDLSLRARADQSPPEKPENYPEYSPKEPSQPLEPDLSHLNGSLTRDQGQSSKSGQDDPIDDSRGDFSGFRGGEDIDLPEDRNPDPVPETNAIEEVIGIWNETFRGTTGEYHQIGLPSNVFQILKKRLESEPNLDNFRKVFQAAREEFNAGAHPWALPTVFRQETTFDILLAKSGMPKPRKRDDKTVCRGYSDPATYATMEEWANIGKGKYATAK